MLDIPVYGVCTLDAIALEAAAALGGSGDRSWSPPTRVARRSTSRRTTRAAGAAPAPVVDRPAAVATDLPVAGEGGVLYPEHFPRAVAPALPSAGWLAQGVVDERVELTGPEPRYLRRPDAVAPGAPKRVT